MDQMSGSNVAWGGETERISKAMIDKHLSGLESPDPIYYMAGTPGLVAILRKVLNEGGVDDDDIRTEEFSGY